VHIRLETRPRLGIWRCRNVDCLVTGAGWLALSLLALAGAGLWHNVISGYDRWLQGTPGRLRARSDWDFQVDTSAFSGVAERLPGIVAPLRPVVAQWDRLSTTWSYMLILAGPVKVDLIFAEPHAPCPLAGDRRDPAWHRRPLLGLAAVAVSQAGGWQTRPCRGRTRQSAPASAGPTRRDPRPASLGQAIVGYQARNDWEQRLRRRVSRIAEQAVSGPSRARTVGLCDCCLKTALRGQNCLGSLSPIGPADAVARPRYCSEAATSAGASPRRGHCPISRIQCRMPTVAYTLSVSQDSAPRNIVICTAPMGDGHTAAAEHIKAALLAAWPTVTVDVIDLTSHIYRHVPLSRNLRSFYRFAATAAHGKLHALMYAAFDSYPHLLSQLTDAVWGARARRYLRGHAEVDLAIATFPTVAFVLSRRLPREIPLLVYVTDAGRANRIWFCADASCYLVIDETAREVALTCGVPPERIAVLGPPYCVRRAASVPAQADARRQLGLDGHFTVLFTAGGAGIGTGVLQAAATVARSRLPVRAILNAGDNRRLAAEFARLEFPIPPLIFGLTSDLVPLIAAADVVIGKAGTMTLTEASWIGRPTLIVHCVPGQEYENAAYAIARKVARAVRPDQASQLLARYLSYPDLLRAEFEFGAAQAQLSHWSRAVVAAASAVARVPPRVSGDGQAGGAARSRKRSRQPVSRRLSVGGRDLS
jgi:processive 1,2-diacylglycerol beta-glucosyltransferase